MDIALPINYEERDFIQACARQERWAQQWLYEEYYSPMMGVCMRYASCEEDAMDILHEGFIKVFRHIGKYEAGTSLSSWMRRIMVNTSIDYYRKVVRRRTEDLDHAQHISSMEADAVSRCTEQEILEAIQGLPTTYRTVFNLYVMEGYSHKEIGVLLNISESTSRSNLVKARTKLKAILTRKYGEPGV